MINKIFCIFILGLTYSLSSFSFPARFGLSPDNAKELVLNALNDAKKKILFNIYEFESQEVTDQLIRNIKAGVVVNLLIEGKPVNAISAGSKKMLGQIRQAMTDAHSSESHIYIMTGAKRRYTFDHAKYLVIDSKAVLISSENFTNRALATPGDVGNRGWETYFENADTAQKLTSIFETDTDPSYGDIVEFKSSFPVPEDTIERRPVPTLSGGYGEVLSVTLLSSPNSLSGIQGLIRSAKEHLEIEFMSLPSTWLTGAIRKENPLVTELVAAAKRGVKIRVLLNDDWVFSPHKPPNAPLKANEITVQRLQAYARCYGYPILANIVDVKTLGITYIHNKGILVDDAKAFVSSINGTQNSVVANREIGVILDSPEAARYYSQAFAVDWEKSKPQTMSEIPCP